MTPRVPPLAIEEIDEATAELLSAIRAPGGRGTHLFRTLARHPRLLRNWAAFSGVLISHNALPARERELLTLRTAWLCRSEYEWGQHTSIAAEVGVTPSEIAAIPDGPSSVCWNTLERALLQAVDELHSDARIAEDTWDVLAAHYDAKQLIELCMVVGQYHLVAFTLNSLAIEPEPGVDVFPQTNAELNR